MNILVIKKKSKGYELKFKIQFTLILLVIKIVIYL